MLVCVKIRHNRIDKCQLSHNKGTILMIILTWNRHVGAKASRSRLFFLLLELERSCSKQTMAPQLVILYKVSTCFKRKKNISSVH